MRSRLLSVFGALLAVATDVLYVILLRAQPDDPQSLRPPFIVGLIAGVLASLIVGSAGGIIVDIVVGIVGAFIGGWLFAAAGWRVPFAGLAGTIFVAFIGAVILLVLVHLIHWRPVA